MEGNPEQFGRQDVRLSKLTNPLVLLQPLITDQSAFKNIR